MSEYKQTCNHSIYCTNYPRPTLVSVYTGKTNPGSKLTWGRPTCKCGVVLTQVSSLTQDSSFSVNSKSGAIMGQTRIKSPV